LHGEKTLINAKIRKKIMCWIRVGRVRGLQDYRITGLQDDRMTGLKD